MDTQHNVDYLFHYTSIDKLALILKNKTIRLNSLSKMDDLQEKRTEDLRNITSFFYVSSWTEETDESIPMWKMYTNIESGIRIGLPVNPFVYQGTNIHEAEKLGLHFDVDNPEDIRENTRANTFLDYVKLINSGIYSTAAWNGNLLVKVEYTDAPHMLEPKVVNLKGPQYNIDFTKIGKYKNKYWDFQKEWRYLINFFPIKLTPDTEKFQKKYNETIIKLLDDRLSAPFDYYDLSIRKNAMDKMTITSSPKMTEGNKVLLESLLEKYGFKGNYKNSTLLGLI